jgi:quinol monooxygenase YgiN
MTSVGLIVRLEARPGKEEEVAIFLRNAQLLVENEPETVSWLAVRHSRSSFAIVDAFTDDAGRRAHLTGPVAAALMQRADELFAEPPRIEPVDVLAEKRRSGEEATPDS